jgi:ABC-2 type transport system permease protein
VIVLVGMAAFSLMGIGYTAFIPNADSAPAIVQLPYLVLQFISGVFFPFRLMPGWLQVVASIFPLRWLVDGIRAGYLGLDYLPAQAASGDSTPERVSGLAALTSQWPGLLIMGLWGAAGLVVALRRFRWEKRQG